MSHIVGKMPYLAIVEKSCQKFLDPDTEADNFQTLIDSSLFRATPLVKFS